MLYELLSNGKKGHNHFVALDPTQMGTLGLFTSSSNEKHSHNISIDPQTGQPIVESVYVGREKTPHNHRLELVSEEEIDEDVDEDDMELIKSLREKFDEAYRLENESRLKGRESEEYYEGKMWTSADIAKLDSENRAHIEINEIAPKVDLLCGYQRQNRTDVKYFPIETGDSNVAEVLTMLTDHIFSINKMEMIESATFKDMVTVGRGNFHAYVDYSNNVLGEVKVENISWRDVFYGPHEKLDASDCEWIIKSKWFSKEKLKKLYPEKADLIDNIWVDYQSLDRATTAYTIPGKEYTVEGNPMSLNKYDVDLRKKMIRVYELWEKDYDKSYSVVQPETEYVINVDNLSKNEIKQIESLGFITIEKVKTKMKVTKAIGNVLLNSYYEDQDIFPVIPSYAKKGLEKFYGLVEPLKQVNMEVNKRHSQAIDVVNRVASYGYIYDNDTFDAKEEQEFRANSSRSGFISKVKNKNNIPQKMEGVRMPTELVGMMELSSSKIEKIASISPEMMGFNQREMSSVALMETRRIGLQAHEYLFDNFAQAKRNLCLLLTRYMKKIYSVERILRIINTKSAFTEEQMQMNQLNAEAATQVLETTDILGYDVNVALSADSPSTRSATLALYLEMIQRGIQLPPEVLIEATDIPAKSKILGLLSQQAQAAAAAEKAKSDAEVEKTKIAAQSKIDAANIKNGIQPQQAQQQAPVQGIPVPPQTV